MANATAEQLARMCLEQNPDKRFAYSRCGGAVGVWVESLNRFFCIYMKTIIPPCPWIDLEGQEIQINGKPPIPDEDWTDVSNEPVPGFGPATTCFP